MGEKRLVVPRSFVACAVLIMVLLSAADARAAEGTTYEVGSTKYVVGQTEAFKCGLASVPLTFESTVLGQSAKLTATGVECLESTLSQGVLNAEAGLKLVLTGVSVDAPSECKIPATITSKALSTKTVMLGTGLYAELKPKTEGGAIATIKLEGCGAAGSFPIKGTLFAKANPTGTLAKAQSLAFSAEAQKAGGGILELGEETATLTASLSEELAGTDAGQEWRVTEGKAPPPEEGTTYEVGSTKFKAGQTETLKCSLTSSPLTLESVVLGTPVKITATGVECLEGTLEQGELNAEARLTLKLTGVSVDFPSECKIPATITSKALTTKTVMLGTGLYAELKPKTEGGAIATIKLEGCAASATIPLKGILLGKSNPTATLAKAQPLGFSAEAQKAGGAALFLGEEPATFTGAVGEELAGTNAGKEWRVTEGKP